MDTFDKLLFEDLVKAYEEADVTSEDMWEIYERFVNLDYLEESKPYILTMRFFGWGTEENQKQVLQELEKLITSGFQSLKGLYFDLRLQLDEANKSELLKNLNIEFANGYTDKYLKEKSNVSKIILAIKREESKKYSVKFALGAAHTVAITKDGYVLATGMNIKTSDVGKWKNVIEVSASAFSTAALKNDGTVYFIGARTDRAMNSKEEPHWSDIIAISAGDLNTVGLKKDGKVVTIGSNKYGECNTYDWTDIISISAKGKHTVGLKSDGTVLATGSNENGQCNVETWRNIIAISAGIDYTLGLTMDGKVMATNYIGANYHGQCDVNTWKDIIAISAGACYALGLRADGTVISTRLIGNDKEKRDCGQTNVSTWSDIISIKASGIFSVGVKEDGTFITTGSNNQGQCDINTWRI